MPRANPRRFVVLDRDGTINVDQHYLDSPDGLELLPGAVEGLKKMADLGLGLVVATNQSGVGRGYFSLEDVDKVHAKLHRLLAVHGVFLSGVYLCPHAPNTVCRCRKPEAGLIEAAVRDHGFDPAQAFVVGDKTSDVDLGLKVGACSILVRTGKGSAAEFDSHCRPHVVVDDLLGAAEWIAERLSHASDRRCA